MAAKVDEFQPHPVKDQLPGIDYCVSSSPPWPEAILLGFQHYLVMLGTTVIIPTILVPQMGGGNRFKQSMRGIQGAVMVASILPIVVGFLGFWRIAVRYLSPLSAVPLVTLTGLGLFYLGFPQLANCIEIGLPELVLLVLLSQYIPHMIKSKRAIFDRFSVIFSVAIVWLYALVLTKSGAYDGRPANTQLSCRTDRSGLISAAPWVRIPYPFQWGRPSINAGDVFAVMAASLVALIESTGTFIAASRFGSATPVPPSVLSRGAGWQVAVDPKDSPFLFICL